MRRRGSGGRLARQRTRSAPPPLHVVAQAAAAACGGGGGDSGHAGRLGHPDTHHHAVLDFADDKERLVWYNALRAVADAAPSIADFQVLHAIGKGGGGQVFLVRRQRHSRRRRPSRATMAGSPSSPSLFSTSFKHEGKHRELDAEKTLTDPEPATTAAAAETNTPLLAMKVVQKFSAFHSETSLQHTLDERLVLQLASSHPFVVPMHYAFQSEKAFYLLTEFCSGGDLRGLLSRSPNGRLSEASARPIFAQIVLALEHIHSLNVIYRDLKPENILLTANGDVRLCDFGLSKLLSTGRWGRTKSFCGTTGYMSPEMVKRSKPYGIASDLWSLGALFYRALVGRGPFDTVRRTDTAFARSADESDTFRRIMHDDVEFPSNLSAAARELLGGLLQKNEDIRLNLEEVKESAFFTDVNWDDVLDQGRKSKHTQSSLTNSGSMTESECSDVSFESGKSAPNLANFDLRRLNDVVLDEGELAGSNINSDASHCSGVSAGRCKRYAISRLPVLHRLVPKHQDSTTVVGYAFATSAQTSTAKPQSK
jgi:serine/threonine protein kinase